MKKIYFVRHGECEGNVGPILLGFKAPLTDKGRQQAEVLAERCVKLPIEAFISSPAVRAKQTAEIIAAKIGKQPEFSELFLERRRPKEQSGKPRESAEFLRIEQEMRDNFGPGWRFSDEENFDDLKARAGQALEFLANRSEENILVVTHGRFLRILAAYAILGDKLTGYECRQFMLKFHTQNTGLTIMCYDEKYKDWPWWLWIWNDHVHLG